MRVCEILVEILERYPQEYEKDSKISSPYYRELKQRIEKTFAPLLDEYGLGIKALGGLGVMRKTPYITFLAEGHRTNKGIYPNYHFDLEQQLVYLGIGDADDHEPPQALVNKFATLSSELLSQFQAREEDGYPRKVYPKDELQEDKLIEDLRTVFEVYQLCLEEFNNEIQEYLQIGKSKKVSGKRDVIWVIQAGSGGRFWNEWQTHGCISIGWSKLGNPSHLKIVSDIQAALIETYPTKANKGYPSMTHINDAHSVDNFVNKMQIGDWIAAIKGRNTILGVGEVKSKHEYVTEPRLSDPDHANIREVTWLKTEKIQTKRGLPLKTLTPLYPNYINYQKLMEYMDDRLLSSSRDASHFFSPKQLETLWKRFHSRIPGFTDFTEPGEFFKEQELDYKQRALKRYQEELGNEQVQLLLNEGEGQNALKEISKRITANFVQFNSWRQSIGETDGHATAILQAFLDVAQQEYLGHQTLLPIFEQTEKQGLKPSWDTLSVLLWAMRPTDYAPIKISYYRKLAEELGHYLPSGRPTPEKFDTVLKWMQGFWDALKEYHPSDWIDVQSFIWCICPDTSVPYRTHF